MALPLTTVRSRLTRVRWILGIGFGLAALAGLAVLYVVTRRVARPLRRIAAAVNGVTRLSTEALEQGLVNKGLQCLFELNRYETDDAFRTEIDARQGLEAMRTRRQEIASTLGPGEIGGSNPRAPEH